MIVRDARSALDLAAQHVIDRKWSEAVQVGHHWGLGDDLIIARARELQPALMAMREAGEGWT